MNIDTFKFVLLLLLIPFPHVVRFLWYLPYQIVPEMAARCNSNLNLCSNNRVFLSDGFQKFQKICDFICPGAWFLVVNLGSKTIVFSWLILVHIFAIFVQFLTADWMEILHNFRERNVSWRIFTLLIFYFS